MAMMARRRPTYKARELGVSSGSCGYFAETSESGEGIAVDDTKQNHHTLATASLATMTPMPGECCNFGDPSVIPNAFNACTYQLQFLVHK
jgi:hypothetical protein